MRRNRKIQIRTRRRGWGGVDFAIAEFGSLNIEHFVPEMSLCLDHVERHRFLERLEHHQIQPLHTLKKKEMVIEKERYENEL